MSTTAMLVGVAVGYGTVISTGVRAGAKWSDINVGKIKVGKCLL